MSIDFKKIKKSYGTNLKAEVEGRWFDLALIEGVQVRVARAGNPIYKKTLQKLYKPYAKQLRRGQSLTPEVEDKIQTKLLCEALLLDWKGMPADNGGEVPFSKQVAKQLLSDPELKELKEEIIAFSEEFEAFQEAMDEDLEKN